MPVHELVKIKYNNYDMHGDKIKTVYTFVHMEVGGSVC
jgi:hypothetical protein